MGATILNQEVIMAKKQKLNDDAVREIVQEFVKFYRDSYPNMLGLPDEADVVAFMESKRK
jgi:hypothetical protein